MPKLKEGDVPLTDEEEAAIQAMIAANPDDFELGDEFFKNAKHISELDPEFYANWLKSEEPLVNDEGLDDDAWNRAIFERTIEFASVEGAVNVMMACGADMSEFENRVAHLEPDASLLTPKSYEWWMGARARKGKSNGAVRVEIDLDVAYIFQREGDGWEKRLNDTLRKAVMED